MISSGSIQDLFDGHNDEPLPDGLGSYHRHQAYNKNFPKNLSASACLQDTQIHSSSDWRRLNPSQGHAGPLNLQEFYLKH